MGRAGLEHAALSVRWIKIHGKSENSSLLYLVSPKITILFLCNRHRSETAYK